MSILFGGEKVVSSSAPVIGSLRLSTSVQGKAVPVVYGQTRIPYNLLWYGAFTPIPHTSTQSSGGKGGGGVTSSTTTYTYTAAVVQGLCEGPITGVINVWENKEIKSLASLGLSFFSGSYAQSPFGYLTANFPGQDLNYRGTAYVASGALDLGTSAALPQYNFEVQALNQYGSIASRAKTYTVDPVTGIFTAAAHGFSNSTAVRFTTTGTVPAGINSSATAPQPGWVVGLMNMETAQWWSPDHEFAEDDAIRFTIDAPGALPSGMSAGVTYYVINAQGAYFQISATLGGTSVTLTDTGTAGTADPTATLYPDPTILQALDYYVINSVANTFQVATVPGGTALTFGDAGTGVQTVTPYIQGANPATVITENLTNAHYGIGFPSTSLAALTNLSNFCVANGIFVSPAYSEQVQASEMLASILRLCNSGAVFSEGMLKIIPYSDASITANGVTFTANTTPIYDLDDRYFVHEAGTDPVQVTRKRAADAFNQVQVIFYDRTFQYNQNTATVKDQAAIDRYGLRPMPPITFREISDPDTAKLVAQMILQRELYVRNTYRFKLRTNFILLEPTDLVTLTDTAQGLNLTPVRITRITETEDSGDWALEVGAEDFITGAATPTLFPVQPGDGEQIGAAAAPGNVNAPIFLTAPFQLTDGALELWVGISGGANFGGCDVWISDDNVGYRKAGTFHGKSRMGVTTSALSAQADPDTTTTLGVNLSQSGGELAGGTQTDVENFNTLSYVAGELIAYRDAVFAAANQYNLSYLRRGVYGSPVGFAAAGSSFLRLDDAVFKIGFPAAYNGRTIFLKFAAFNARGTGKQSLADVSAYSATLSMQYAGLPPMPNITGLELFGGGTSTTFSGRDAKFLWRQASKSNSFEIGSEPFGGNSGGLDPYFKDYEVRIYATETATTPLRVEHTTDTHYVYTYEKNVEDNSGSAQRSFTIKVYARGQQGQLSSIPATLSVSNPQPALPVNADIRATGKNVFFSYDLPSETDWAGVIVWMSSVNGFSVSGTTPGSGNCVYAGTETLIVKDASGYQTWYLRFASFDTFGRTGLTISDQYTATTIGFSNADIADLAAAKLTGQITTTQITDSAVTTPKINAGAVVAGKLAASAIVANDGVIASLAVTNSLLAGGITADKVSVAGLSTITANIGTITSGSITSTANIDVAGVGRFRGATTISGGPSGSFAIIGNDTNGATHGGIGMSNTSTASGLIGYHTGNGYGLTGECDSSSGVGTRGLSSDGKAIEGIAVNSGALGARFKQNNSTKEGIIAGDSYAFYAASGGYGPFTGSHEGCIPKTDSLEIGDILCRVGSPLAKRSVSDTIFAVELCSREGQRGAIGVVADRTAFSLYDVPAAFRDPGKPNDEMAAVAAYANVVETHDRVITNALGEGQVNVCGAGGSIRVGDYIVCSALPGKGMRGTVTALDPTVVAEACEDADFGSATEVKMIACIYRR